MCLEQKYVRREIGLWVLITFVVLLARVLALAE